MKNLLRFSLLALLMTVFNSAWADDVTVSMSSFSAISGNVDGDSNISYEAAKGNASTAPAVNNGQIRVYQNGGTFTVSANNGATIKSVTLGSAMKTSVTCSVDGGSAGEAQSISANGTLTVGDLNCSSILFTCVGTTTSTRLYVNSLSVTYTPPTTQTVATPTFSPEGGEYTAAQSVTISCATDGASIYYTTDGSTPTNASTQYTEPITVSGSTTIKAIAYVGDDASSVASADYTIITPIPGYTINFESEASAYVDWEFTNMLSNQSGNITAHGGSCYGTTGGKYTASITTTDIIATPQSLTCYVSKLTGNTTASTWKIQVSDDGSTWTEVAKQSAIDMSAGEWKEFTANLSSYTNVYVGIFYEGTNAVRAIDDLTLDTTGPAVATPTFSPEGGEYEEAQTVTISCDTEDATIYYTLDGSEPTTESWVYSEPISIEETTTVKAIAYKGDDASSVASVTYYIITPIPATTYVKVTNANQLVAGNEYILVTDNGKAMGSQNNNYRNYVNVTLSDDKVTITNEAVAVMTLGGSTGAWTFNTSEGYLSYTSGNSVSVATETSDATNWIITNDFELESAYAEGRYLQYNSGSPRFACYTNTQAPAYLYVKEGSPVGKTPVASSCTITPTEVAVGTSGSFDAAIEANFNGLDLTDWSSDNPEVLSVSGSYYEAHQVGTVTVTFNCKPLDYVEGSENYEAVAFTQTVTVYDPNAKGTLNNPYTVEEALALTELPTNDVYVTGIISKIDNVNTSNGDATYWISDDGTTANQMKVYRGKYLDGADFTAEDQIAVGDGVKICGKLSVYQGANQFGSDNSKIVELSHKIPVASNCTITPTEIAVGTSGSFDAAFEANFNGLDLTDWSSDNPEVLSVNASYYEAHQVGTVTVTFNCKPMEGVEGWENYAPVAFTQTVTVYDPNAPTEVTATFDATIDLAETGSTAGEWSITKDGLTISADGGVGGNGTDYRIYKNTTFTVSCTVGKITKIEFSADSSNPVSGFGEVEGLVGNTWTGNAKSVSFTASNKQVRLTLVNITYEPAFILSDLLNEKTPYTNDEDKQVPMVIYKREFSSKTAGHRQCWFVPFDYTITDEDIERCTFYRIHMFSAPANQEGVVQDENKVVMNIVEVESGYTLSANKPYIIKPKTAGVYEFVAENAKLKARDTGSLKYTSTSTNRYDFYGVYNSYSADAAKQWFSLNTNGNLLWNAAGQSLGAYRWYITSTYTGDDYANIVFVIDEDSEGDETTAIEQLFNNPNAEIEGLYTVDGIKLYKPAKGLNIVKYTDGRTKKVYIK